MLHGCQLIVQVKLYIEQQWQSNNKKTLKALIQTIKSLKKLATIWSVLMFKPDDQQYSVAMLPNQTCYSKFLTQNSE